MYVIKRDGRRVECDMTKIQERIRRLSTDLDKVYCDTSIVIKKTIAGLYPGVTTAQLDILAAEVAISLSTTHPDYAKLAARLYMSNLHKQTIKSFSDTIKLLYFATHPVSHVHTPLVSKEEYEFVMQHKDVIDPKLDYSRDYQYDYFGMVTLVKSYLFKLDGQVAERPQHLIMRVAVGIHLGDLDAIFETYELMSRGVFTHATPTLFNAGTTNPQMSSCFLLTMKSDSIAGIYETLSDCPKISKYAGGIGLAIHQIRAKDSYIAGTNGNSNGLVPMLRVFDGTARYVDQGGGKRKGSIAIYLEPYHADIEDFLELKKNKGKEEMRARDLFYALWVPDLFMKRVEEDGDWTLFCPNEAPGMSDVYGEEFEKLYTQYEQLGIGRKTIRAQDLWTQILNSQIETGTPYMLYKDACNRKSNQNNLGTIKCSNLCTEIIQYTSEDEIAVCNLASISLKKFIVSETEYNFAELARITRFIVRNLNKIIDLNKYPVPEAEKSNLRHRPMGIGVQGLADTFILMRMPYDSADAFQLNRDIFETIYYGACKESMELAKVYGPYSSFPGSLISQGLFQFDLWDQKPNPKLGWDWEGLRQDIMKYGIRNSLLIAPMPTASTAQILGNNESFEPIPSNIFSRRVLAGDFMVVNKYLVKDLIAEGLWSTEMKNKIVAARGSIQGIPEIPSKLKELYKTVWEIKQRHVIDMAASRGAFIDQSQSLNIHLANPTIAQLTNMHMYGWKSGLKTGMYYLRTLPKANPLQFTIDAQVIQALKPLELSRAVSNNSSEEELEKLVCTKKEDCFSCGS